MRQKKVFDFLFFILFHALSSPQVKFWPSPNSRPRKSSNPLCSNNKGATFGYFTFFNYSKALKHTRAWRKYTFVCKNFFCRPLKWTRMSPQGMILKRKSTRRRSWSGSRRRKRSQRRKEEKTTRGKKGKLHKLWRLFSVRIFVTRPPASLETFFVPNRDKPQSILFIGPESDHWLCLSLTHSLTH